ncbi:hypothetical protein BDW69DRAFT_105626 [Aspergillus filifer]
MGSSFDSYHQLPYIPTSNSCFPFHPQSSLSQTSRRQTKENLKKIVKKSVKKQKRTTLFISHPRLAKSPTPLVLSRSHPTVITPSATVTATVTATAAAAAAAAVDSVATTAAQPTPSKPQPQTSSELSKPTIAPAGPFSANPPASPTGSSTPRITSTTT